MTNNSTCIWSVARRVFHEVGCRWAAAIREKNLRRGSVSEAGGRRPCKCCRGQQRDGSAR